MAHPLVWPKKSFFYPIGNTPATQFTTHLAPEEPANVLLLGCGDARGVLFTVLMEPTIHRKLDFTCCDHEPAVLARNILLYTMLIEVVDNKMIQNIWNIYHHFYLDKPSLQQLLQHCQKLVDLSVSLDKWNAHPYGQHIKFCTNHTFIEIRRHWLLYLSTDALPENEKKELRSTFKSGMLAVQRRTEIKYMVTSSRSAGPLSLKIGTLGSNHYKQFWKSGLTAGTSKELHTYLNPTFAYSVSGRGFNVHYGTDPILAFHLAPALTAIQGNNLSPATTTEKLLAVVRLQFSNWCQAFHTRITLPSPNIQLRFFVGDVLAFCKALRLCAETGCVETGLYAGPWGGTQINFLSEDYDSSSRRSPLSFNVIDTSNLSDHLGLLNVLLATVPLLRRHPTSVLRTETLLAIGSRDNTTKGALHDLGLDVAMLSLVFGVVPSNILSSFICQSLGQEAFTIATEDIIRGQFHDPLVWKLPYRISDISAERDPPPLAVQPIICEAVSLGNLFFSFYLKLFEDENIGATFNLLKLNSIPGFAKKSALSYNRNSFSEFLSAAKATIRTDWEQAVNQLIDRILTDRSLIMGSNNYQDLTCQLYMQNIHSVPWPVVDQVRKASQMRFRDWEEVPPVICIVLEVPRDRLRVLENIGADVILTPMLQCEMRGASFHNIHSSIRPIFGTVKKAGKSFKYEVNIREDPLGWNGNASLIVSFYMPAWILTCSPTPIRIGLHIRSTPSSISLMSKLGPMLEIYGTNVTDVDHVHILPHRPDNPNEAKNLSLSPTLSKHLHHASDQATSNMTVTATLNNNSLSAITLRASITDPLACKTLSSVSTTVDRKQISSIENLLQFGNQKQHFAFPFPVDNQKLKVRIARKSSFLELEAPIQADYEPGKEACLAPFPIVNAVDMPQLLNIQYLNLDQLPSLCIRDAADADWLQPHLGFTFTEQETSSMRHTKNDQLLTAFLNLKRSLCAIFLKFANRGEDGPLTFALSNPNDGRIYTLFFVSKIRLDLAAHTVVVDACMLGLELAMLTIPVIKGTLSKLQPIVINTCPDEIKLWKHLIPALVERCRTWSHTSQCEYRGKAIPLSVQFSESPICQCGFGKNLGPFLKNPAWKDLVPYVTRVAIGPLFPGSYEKVGVLKMMEDMTLSGDVPSKQEPKTHRQERCMKCHKPGKPSLLVCSNCKDAKYCSVICQKAHWKEHKVICAVSKSKNKQ